MDQHQHRHVHHDQEQSSVESSSEEEDDDDDEDDDSDGLVSTAAAAAGPRCNGGTVAELGKLMAGLMVPPHSSSAGTVRFAADDDSYNLTAFDQVEGNWPIGDPLPMPAWSVAEERPILIVDTLWRYEEMVAVMETVLHQMLEETHYDTVHNYADFYAAFRSRKTKNLRRFFQQYTPPVNRRHHMCVSLAMEVITRLAAIAPVFGSHMYLVSCEEAVDSTKEYIDNCYNVDGSRQMTAATAHFTAEKEHALVAMRVRVAGRDGLIVLDPGYHVARAVTVMRDQQYPHSGWFVQSEEGVVKREYCYAFSGSSEQFVEWQERTTRGGKESHERSLVYVGKKYRTAIDVTVRRNLVYNFRSLLSRSAKGRVLAGIYFPVVEKGQDAHLTLFYEDDVNGTQVKVKQKFAAFLTEEVRGRRGRRERERDLLIISDNFRSPTR